ncbi:hypothetical protein AB0887_18975 [Streptomyces huasconensis]|uniref:Uncharacterized protein n=1 Tax=Streptomyces huasconensis TaxID=1854574 RepID=A0ABV3LX22_9ACTN
MAVGNAGRSVPIGIAETAPGVTRDGRLVIHGPLEHVWCVQPHVENWLTWQPNVSFPVKQTAGKLRPVSSWVWFTGGFEDDITSAVKQVQFRRRIVWGGPAQGVCPAWNEGFGTASERDVCRPLFVGRREAQGACSVTVDDLEVELCGVVVIDEVAKHVE